MYLYISQNIFWHSLTCKRSYPKDSSGRRMQLLTLECELALVWIMLDHLNNMAMKIKISLLSLSNDNVLHLLWHTQNMCFSEQVETSLFPRWWHHIELTLHSVRKHEFSGDIWRGHLKDEGQEGFMYEDT